MKTPEAWERQLGESSRAWEARRTYLNLGPTRSIARVGQELGKCRAGLERLSVRWNWVLTAVQYDAYNDSIASREVVEQRAAKLKAEAEKWAGLDERYPSMMMDVFILAYNDLIEAEKAAKAAKRVVNWRQRAAMIRNIARAAPMAEAALAIVKARQAKAIASGRATSASVPAMPGRTLAVLRAFNEYRPIDDETG